MFLILTINISVLKTNQNLMSKPNNYGFSTQMNPKLKKLLTDYKPEDRSEITALRNKKPMWSMNTIQRLKLSGGGHQEPLTVLEVFTIIASLAFLTAFLAVIFSL